MVKLISTIFNNFSKILYSPEPYKQLGRWCHPGIPNCTPDVLLRKIDFANSDNNLCNKNKKNFVTVKIPFHKLDIYDINNTKNYTPQEYIDSMHN